MADAVLIRAVGARAARGRRGGAIRVATEARREVYVPAVGLALRVAGVAGFGRRVYDVGGLDVARGEAEHLLALARVNDCFRDVDYGAAARRPLRRGRRHGRGRVGALPCVVGHDEVHLRAVVDLDGAAEVALLDGGHRGRLGALALALDVDGALAVVAARAVLPRHLQVGQRDRLDAQQHRENSYQPHRKFPPKKTGRLMTWD